MFLVLSMAVFLQVRQALRESAKVLGGTAPNDNFGYGLVQAKTALAKLSKLC